jgi:hypothetical protein
MKTTCVCLFDNRALVGFAGIGWFWVFGGSRQAWFFQPGDKTTTSAKMCMRALSGTRHAAWCCWSLLDEEKATFARSLVRGLAQCIYIWWAGEGGEIAFLHSFGNWELLSPVGSLKETTIFRGHFELSF